MSFCAWLSYRRGLALTFSAAFSSVFMTAPAAAGGGDFAAGLLGGMAVGTVVGSVAAQPRYYAPYDYYPPVPVYVPAPRCWFEHRRVWDGYGYIIESVRVCE